MLFYTERILLLYYTIPILSGSCYNAILYRYRADPAAILYYTARILLLYYTILDGSCCNTILYRADPAARWNPKNFSFLLLDSINGRLMHDHPIPLFFSERIYAQRAHLDVILFCYIKSRVWWLVTILPYWPCFILCFSNWL